MPPKSKKSSSSKTVIPQEQLQQISIKESAIFLIPSVSEQVSQIIYAVQAMNSKAFNQIWDDTIINTTRSVVVHGGGRIFASKIIEGSKGQHLIVFDKYVSEHSATSVISYRIESSLW